MAFSTNSVIADVNRLCYGCAVALAILGVWVATCIARWIQV